jgi:arylsulfatase A-like enzyme
MIVVLVVVDSLRADHVGACGGRAVTPTLDRLASEGALFETVWSCSPWTLPALAGLLSGTYGHRAGLIHWQQTWPTAPATLFQRLAGEGFDVASFVFDPAYLFTGLGAAQVRGRSGDEDDFFRFVSGWRGTKLFLFVHYWGTHVPYVAAPMSPATWQELTDGVLQTLREGGQLVDKVRGVYRHAVERFSEQWLPRLLAALRGGPGLDDAVVAITADHGESWGERLPPGHRIDGVFDLHGNHLYEEALRVPLVLWAPTRIRPSTRVRELVRTVDLAPTLLDLALGPAADRSAVDDDRDGRSLLPRLSGLGPTPDTEAIAAGNLSLLEIVCEEPFPPPATAVWDRLALRTERLSWIWHTATDERRAYDLEHDPTQSRPLSPTAPELEHGWQRLAAEAARARLAPVPAALRAEQLARARGVHATLRRR